MKKVMDEVKKLAEFDDCYELDAEEANVVNNAVRMLKEVHRIAIGMIDGTITTGSARVMIKSADKMSIAEPDRYQGALRELRSAYEAGIEPDDETPDVDQALSEIDCAIDALQEALEEQGFEF